MSFYDSIPKLLIEINNNNYLLNCYNHLTRIKGIHFLFILIEILLNIILQLETILRGYKFDIDTKQISGLNIVTFITRKFNNISNKVKLIIIIIYIIICDSLFIFLKIKKIIIRHICISVIVNILEIFVFRICMLIFLNLFFTLEKELFFVGYLFFIPHLYLVLNNFLNYHLYYFVPEFIVYPYDEFSSIYDIILFIIKLLTSISSTSINIDFAKFCFIILFLFHILYSFYFIYKMTNHSYLFMKNTFLNIARLCFFFSNTIILFIVLLLGKNEIMTVLFLIVSISTFIIIMSYIYSIYNPFCHIKIRRETPFENTIFYFYIISQKNDLKFLFENILSNHYKNCRICNLCKKYIKYKNTYKQNELIDDEKEQFINNEIDKNNLMDLFDVINDNKNKYFQFLLNIVLNYKYKSKEKEFHNSFYFINLCYLIYYDYLNNNKNLSLNEALILEVLNKEKRALIINNYLQIYQILLCNHFTSLSQKILSQLKDILNSELSFNKAKKLLDLSYLLKQLKSRDFKEILFTHKNENISHSRHLILICSIIYEEIFNTTLNNSQIPIRENIQPLEDIFNNNSHKINKLISLLVDLANKKCKIVRASKGLYSHINKNLFDLFPLIFKKYQANLFMKSVFENFGSDEKDNDENDNDEIKRINTIKYSSKNIKLRKNNKNKNKKGFMEIKLILCENIASRIYFKLLTLKLIPLFNHNISYFILFNGFYYIHKNTLITLQDFERNQKAKEILISVSEPELENSKMKENYSILFKKYISFQKIDGFMFHKIISFNIKEKYFNVYMLTAKEKESKTNGKKISIIKMEDDIEEFQSNIKRNTKIQLIEDNASASSQNTGSSYSTGVTNLGIRSKKKAYEFKGFNTIKKVNIFFVLISLIIFFCEYLSFNNFQIRIYKNNIILLEYNEFSKLYYQLFSSIISLLCISIDNNCIKIINSFIENYYSSYGQDFDIEKLILVQNEMLSGQLMEKKNNLVNIHKYIGNKKYSQLFGINIKYLKATQIIKGEKYLFKVTPVNMKFSEAILTMCNSFNVLANNLKSEEAINFLSGRDEPFKDLNEFPINLHLDDYQKDFVEMILNYQNYYENFNLINLELLNSFISDSNLINAIIYFYVTFDSFLLLIICFLMYGYLLSFESILIKIINYVNMSMNIRIDDFSFKETFLKKIVNLESILLIFNSDPVKEIQSLNNIYNNYQQFLSIKNKKNLYETNKKNLKNIDKDKDNELENVPKHQRIINRSNVRSLGISSIFTLIFYINILLVFGIFFTLMFLWINFFTKKRNLSNLIEKNNIIENSIYQSINSYDLMIFQNLTIEEISEIFFSNDKIEKYTFIKSFYENLIYTFNNEKEKHYVGNLYNSIENTEDFNCKTIYQSDNEYLKQLEKKINEKNYDDLKNISNILIQLCENLKIADTKDYRTIYERHFQLIKIGILNIKDRSFFGLIEHIINYGTISGISCFFQNVVIYILEMKYKSSKQSFNNLDIKMKYLIQITEVCFIVYNVIAILCVIFFYISRINNLCNQIFILKNVFKIYEIHE